MTITSEQITNLRQLAELCISNDASVDENMAYANFISRIEPETINFLLAHIDAQAARISELEKELATLWEQEPVFQVEVSGNHWLNAGPFDDSDFTGMPDGVNKLYANPSPAPVAVLDDVTSGELYRIVNHIAGAKESLPDEWQPWADDIEDSLRKLLRLNSGSKPGGRIMPPHEFAQMVNELRDVPDVQSKRELIVKVLTSFNIRPKKAAGGSVEDE